MTNHATHTNSTNTADIAIAVTCVVIFALSLIYIEPESKDAAYILGQSVVFALLATIVLRITFLSSAGKKRLAIAYFATLASFFTALIIAGQQRAEREKAALTAIIPELEKDAQALIEARNSRAQFGNKESFTQRPVTSTSISLADDPAAEYRQVQVTLSALMQRQVQMHRDYESELATTGFLTLLDPSRLKSDPTGAKGLVIVQRVRSVVLKHRERSERVLQNLTQDMRQDFSDSGMDRRVVEAFIGGVEKGMVTAQKRAKRLWDLEEEAAAEMGALIALFASAPGWQLKSDNILFPFDEQAAEFNARMSRIDSISKEQEQIRAAADESLRAMVNAFKTVNAKR